MQGQGEQGQPLFSEYQVLHKYVLPDLAQIIKIYIDPRLAHIKTRRKRDTWRSVLVKSLFHLHSRNDFQSRHKFKFVAQSTCIQVPVSLSRCFHLSNETWKNQWDATDFTSLINCCSTNGLSQKRIYSSEARLDQIL